MKLVDAYTQAVFEDDDPIERAEFSADTEMKTCMVDEIAEAMKETSAVSKQENLSKTALMLPMFHCVSFWFLVGIRTGKILRDAELAGK